MHVYTRSVLHQLCMWVIVFVPKESQLIAVSLCDEKCIEHVHLLDIGKCEANQLGYSQTRDQASKRSARVLYIWLMNRK